VDKFQRYLAARTGGITGVEKFEKKTTALKGKEELRVL
jgi:hypothetical protein